MQHRDIENTELYRARHCGFDPQSHKMLNLLNLIQYQHDERNSSAC